jgi:type I restriction enzyme S subunit
MIGDLKPYPAMKDSGVPWLGQVPEHWEVRRLKSCLASIESGSREQSDVGSSDGIPSLGGEHIGTEGQLLLKNMRYISFSFFEKLRKGKIRQNDVLLVKDGATIGKVSLIRALPYPQCAVNEHVFILRPLDCCLPEFLYQNIRSSGVQESIWKKVTGSAQPGLNSSFTKSLPLCLPSLPEQAAIVRFLDHASGRLKQAIRTKKKLIGLLNEQKQAIIHRAVTRGLDPTVPLKPSGISWLGDIPEHWEIRRLKYLATLKSGDNITALQIEPKGEYPVFGGNGLRGYTNRYTHDGHFALIGRQGALCGNINFGELLRIMNLNQYSQSAAQPGLAVERIKNLAAPVPPAKEQQRIVSMFQEQTNGLITAISRLEREIALLREYRTRLIADVVTGKLDVREAAKNLPAEDEEPLVNIEPEEQIEEETAGGEYSQPHDVA